MNSLPLEGLKLSVLGDSISAFQGTIPEGHDVYYTGENSGVRCKEQMWWSILCEKTGMVPCVINSWSGSGVSWLTDPDHDYKVPMSDSSRCEHLATETDSPDVILIAGGVNDYTYAMVDAHVPSGWDGKTAPVEGRSFDETYACMLAKIQKAYPMAYIVAMSTFFTMRGHDNGYTLVNDKGLTQVDYNHAIQRVAEEMHVGFLNVSSIGFNRENYYPNFAEDSDVMPTHPNANGQRVMGEYIACNLPNLVKAMKK